MPELILSGFVRTENGPEEFEVYRHKCHAEPQRGFFTCVDHKCSKRGWGTLNASGGLPAYAAEYAEYWETLADYACGASKAKPFPVDEASHVTDLAWEAQRTAMLDAARGGKPADASIGL